MKAPMHRHRIPTNDDMLHSIDPTGLTGYPVDRPLTDAERDLQLKQKERLEVEPYDNLCVIELNSTYLESVDKWFAWKGVTAVLPLLMIFGCVVVWCMMAQIAWARAPGMWPNTEDMWFMVSITVMLLLFAAFMGWFICREWFAYTHYPMRFNRQTGMVHVFQRDGSVLSERWDKLFFTLSYLSELRLWEVRGHVLTRNRATVRATFALSYRGECNVRSSVMPYHSFSGRDLVRAHWEFIRRYMEEGPQAVIDCVDYCMPVAGRRERFGVGLARSLANCAGAPWILYVTEWPICVVVGLLRPLAMRSCKIPQWSAEVEADTVTDANDRHAISGDPVTAAAVAVTPDSAGDHPAPHDKAPR
jgi:hypothetical protein